MAFCVVFVISALLLLLSLVCIYAFRISAAPAPAPIDIYIYFFPEPFECLTLSVNTCYVTLHVDWNAVTVLRVNSNIYIEIIIFNEVLVLWTICYSTHSCLLYSCTFVAITQHRLRSVRTHFLFFFALFCISLSHRRTALRLSHFVHYGSHLTWPIHK